MNNYHVQFERLEFRKRGMNVGSKEKLQSCDTIPGEIQKGKILPSRYHSCTHCAKSYVTTDTEYRFTDIEYERTVSKTDEFFGTSD